MILFFLIFQLVTTTWYPWHGYYTRVFRQQDVNYGEKGVTHPDNQPGSRKDCGQKLYYHHTNNSVYFYGGWGINVVQYGHLSDVWKFDLNEKIYTWVGGGDGRGDTRLVGSFPDTFHIDNEAGGIQGHTMVKGSDGSDSFFSFWGYMGLYLNGVWEFNVKLRLWKRHIDDQNVNYLAKGDPGTIPQKRFHSTCSRIDDTNIACFGGRRVTTGNPHTCSDLITFHDDTSDWTFFAGTSVYDSSGNYTEIGSCSKLIYPQSRYASISWAHGTKFYLFSGFSHLSGGYFFNDFWKFDFSTSEFCWIGGVNGTTNSPADRDEVIVSSDYNVGNYPSARAYTCVAGFNDVFFMVSGRNSVGVEMTNIWGFDATDESFKKFDVIGTENSLDPVVFGAKYGHSCVSLPYTNSNYIAVYGGYGYCSVATVNIHYSDIWIWGVRDEMCDPTCVHGNCTYVDDCTCEDSYSGETCNVLDVDDDDEDDDDDNRVLIIAIASASGGTVLLILILIVVIGVIICCCKKRKKDDQLLLKNVDSDSETTEKI